MKVQIVTTFIGCFAVDGEKIIDFRIFPKDVEKIVEKLNSSENGLIDEEKDIIKTLERDGIDAYFPFKKPGVDFVEANTREERFVKENQRQFAIKYKFVNNNSELNQILSKVNIEITKSKIKKSVERDKIVIHANGSIEEIDKALNVFVERLRATLFFPFTLGW